MFYTLYICILIYVYMMRCVKKINERFFFFFLKNEAFREIYPEIYLKYTALWTF